MSQNDCLKCFTFELLIQFEVFFNFLRISLKKEIHLKQQIAVVFKNLFVNKIFDIILVTLVFIK
jgi:hypothetical protein